MNTKEEIAVEEILEKYFPNAKQCDWFIPIKKAMQEYKSRSQSEENVAELLEQFKTIEYPAWGHQLVMFWMHDKKWHAGLRNYKLDNPSTFEGESAFDALKKLYDFSLKNGYIEKKFSIQQVTALVKEINVCQTGRALEGYKSISCTDPDLKEAYDNKWKEFLSTEKLRHG